MLRDRLTAAAFLAPLAALMLAFVFYPLVNTARLTFYDYSFIKDTSKFVGLGNYVRWVTDPEMWHSLGVSALFFIYYVPTSMVLGFVVAYAIDRLANRWFAAFYRTIFYFPVVLPAAIVFHMWLNLYDPTYGLFAQVTSAIGLRPVNWLGDTNLALPGVAIMSIWRLLGETVIFMLIGLANIPREMYEQARVDGASEWQIISKVVIPLMTPILFLIFVLRLKVLEVTVEPLFMTNGGPINATMTYGLRAYLHLFREDELGYASTWFVMLALLAVFTAVLVGRRMRKTT